MPVTSKSHLFIGLSRDRPSAPAAVGPRVTQRLGSTSSRRRFQCLRAVKTNVRGVCSSSSLLGSPYSLRRLEWVLSGLPFVQERIHHAVQGRGAKGNSFVVAIRV